MTESFFREQLKQVSESDWKAIFSGQALLMINDSELKVGSPDQPDVIVATHLVHATDPETLKQNSLNAADELYANYYRTHPLTLYGFNDQLHRLVKQYTLQTFCAAEGHRAERTLFVDSGQLIALDKEDPRHAYGVFCELPDLIKPSAIVNYLSHWIERGEAYEAYLSMNVCRYNC